MNKIKKNQPQPISKHSRQPSTQKQRNSHPRLTMYASPPIPPRINANYYLSNPNSLEKRKSKVFKKKNTKSKKIKQQPTRETIQSAGEVRWKQHLKLTFRSKQKSQNQISLHNNSLKCMEQFCEYSIRKPAQSYTTLLNTFPKHEKNTPILEDKERVYLVDWLGLVAGELMLRRNTLHLAVSFIDAYLDSKGSIPSKLHALGSGALLLAVKQEERGTQTELLSILSNGQSGLKKEEIIKVESDIVLGLGFKLNFNTLPFWIDYFSQKWDIFITAERQKQSNLLGELNQHLILLRNPEGFSYKYYREAMQLSDAFLMHPFHKKHDFSKLSMAILYLVIRIQSESKAGKQQAHGQYISYFHGFGQKASPIFKDKWNFNSVFNQFITLICNFQITEIIPAIKWGAQFLNMGFTYDIDSRAYDSSINYQQFLRFTHYSEHIRNYFLSNIF